MLAVVAALTLAACGATHSGQKPTSTTSTATVPPTTATAAAATTTQAPTDATALPGYLAIPTNQVLFIEFTRSGDEISGTVQFAYLSSDGSRIETFNGPIEGKISGSNVTVNDENDVITTSGSVSGTFQGSNLVLAFPQQNGQLAPVQFSPASVANYNNALTTLQDEANQNAAAQQAAAASVAVQAQNQHAITSAAQSVGVKEDNISSDISRLTSDEQDLATAVSSAESEFQDVQSDFAQTKSDAKSDPILTCGNSGVVEGDQGALQGDQGAYQGTLSANQPDTSSVQQDMAALRSDWASLVAAESADPTYVPSAGLPTSSGEASALSTGGSALSKYQQTVTADTRTIAGYLSQANTYVTRANQLCSSSGG